MITALVENLSKVTTTDTIMPSSTTTVVDGLLGTWTLFHVFLALGYMAVPDASYKKALLKLHRKIHKPLTDSTFLIPLSNIFSTIFVANLCRQAYLASDDSMAVARAIVGLHCWATAFFLQKMCSTLVKLGVDYCMKVEKDLEIHDIKAWQKPPKWTGTLATLPLNWFLRPELHGSEHIPQQDQPGLYVMNHALYGMEMAPFVATLYQLKDVFVRGLADHFHFGQLHGEIIRYFGAVDGTRDNVDALMERRQNVLVYPGGGEEIMKPTAVPKYTLMWKERLGFARCAIKHGYPIVPCCSVGTEDMFTRVTDVPVDFIKKGMKAPIVLFRPDQLQKVYFWVGEPIPTAHYEGDYKNDEFAREVRDKVKAAVEEGIRQMQQRQATDPDRYLVRAVGNSILSWFGRAGTLAQQQEKALLVETSSSEQQGQEPTAVEKVKVLSKIDSDDSWEPLTTGSEVSSDDDDDDSTTTTMMETKKNL